MSFHKRKREKRFVAARRAQCDEGLEVEYRCPAFCAVVFAGLFNVVALASIGGYYWMQAEPAPPNG